MANTIGFDPVAWAIDGGRHRAELLRVLAYAATSGAEGIVESPDCRVKQLGTAGPQITMDAGAVLIRNRSASVRNQSYVANGRTQTTLDVAASGGSARSDLVVVRVKDPAYSPWTNVVGGGDPLEFQYVEPFIIQNVPASTTRATQLNLGYSAVEIARIDLPANTTNITTAMIKDMRKLAQPRRETQVNTYSPTNSASSPYVQPVTNGVYGQWIPTNLATLDIPLWATEVKLVVTASQARYNGTMTGRMRAKLVNVGDTQDSGLQNDSGSSRTSVMAGGELAIPTAYRGTSQAVQLWSSRMSGTGTLGADEHTTVVVQAEFVEIPD